VALINKETMVIETGQTVPVTAPDQVVLAGRLEDGAVASIAVQGGSAPVTRASSCASRAPRPP
jgi:hypothetical protein